MEAAWSEAGLQGSSLALGLPKRASVGPYATSGPRAVEIVQNGTLKTYAGFPHGMPTTHADTINADLLTFIQS